jgi:hypothetical protein
VNSWYFAPVETLGRMCAIMSFKVNLRYATLSTGVQSFCYATISNCLRNTAHEVDPSYLGDLHHAWVDSRSSARPELGAVSIVELSQKTRASQASTFATWVLNPHLAS